MDDSLRENAWHTVVKSESNTIRSKSLYFHCRRAWATTWSSSLIYPLPFDDVVVIATAYRWREGLNSKKCGLVTCEAEKMLYIIICLFRQTGR